MKHCPKCQIETERYKNGDCKPCRKIYRANYYIANSKKLRDKSKDYYAENKEKVKATNTAWVKANPNKVSAIQSKYRSANQEKVKARHELYRITNKEKIDVSNAAYRAANPEKIKVSSTVWRAANPEKVKSNSVAHYAANKKNINAWQAAYRAANPEKVKAARAAWEKANPEACSIRWNNRRARKLSNGGTLSKGLFSKLFLIQRGKCPACKNVLSNVKPRSPMDHIIPLAKGGLNIDSNIQLLCQPCNNQKGAKHPVDFMQLKGFLL